MFGTYVIIGASLLGAASCVLIAWSLWSRSQARRRSRQQLPGPQPGAIGGAPGVVPDHGGFDEPATQFLSEADLFAAAGTGHRPTMVLSEPTEELEPPEEHTQFLSSEELFGQEEPKTSFMTEDELFGAQGEPEQPTQFLTSEELYGAGGSASGELGQPAGAPPAYEPMPTVVDMSPPQLPGGRSDETVVLAEGVVLEDAPPPSSSRPGWNAAPPPSAPPQWNAAPPPTSAPPKTNAAPPPSAAPPSSAPPPPSPAPGLDDGFAVAPPRHQHIDRPPVHRIPMAPPPGSAAGPPALNPPGPGRQAMTPQASPRPTPQAPSPRPTPQAASPRPTPRAPSPRPTPRAASPRPTPQAPKPRAPAPVKLPPSRLPAESAVAARPPPRARVRPAPAPSSMTTPEVPQAGAHPPSQSYAGFVGAPLDDDDDDFDDDDDDPETEMVHQSELLRLMGQLGLKPPGSE